MKRLPRIYSLSTLGVRQHQEFDYKFHGFRTDFVGDSGCGKSMIADLLQLIFVGSEVYAPATDSLDDRGIDGMVLKSSQGRGTEMAYAFLNLEILPNQYVVIGTYIESTGKQSKSFIVQAGYDEKQLKLLPKPLETKDILVNDLIPALDDFKRSLDEKGMVCHHFANRKKFHGYLAIHKILSMDLSQSNQLLQDYADIIRSFSRGKTLITSDGGSLKRFLFGDEKAKEIVEKYKKAVDDLHTTLTEYTRNLHDIELVTKKHKALSDLKALKDNHEYKQRLWRNMLCAFRTHQEAILLDKVKELVRDAVDSMSYIDAMQRLILKQLKGQETTNLMLQKEADEARLLYDLKGLLNNQLKPFITLTEKYTATIEELRNIYAVHETNRVKKKSIDSLVPLLKSKNLLGMVEDYFAQRSNSDILEIIDHQISLTETELLQKKSFLAFANINDNSTLGGWAITHGKSLSLEVESIIMHYKSLPVYHEKLQDGPEQFIPQPDNFVNEAVINDPGSDGFWLDTGGIRQHIKYVTRQIFSDNNIKQLTAYLANISEDIKTDIQLLTTHNASLEGIKRIVIENNDFVEFLHAYQNRAALVMFVPDPLLEMSRQDFDDGILLLEKKLSIETDYSNALIDWDAKHKSLSAFEQYIAELNEINEQLNKNNSNKWNEEVLSIIRQIEPACSTSIFDDAQLDEYLEKELLRQAGKEKWIKKIIDDNIQKIKTIEIINSSKSYENAKVATEDAYKETRLLLLMEPNIDEWENVALKDPVTEQNAFEVAQALFKNKFDEIVLEHISGDKYKFEVSRNYIELCATLLPEAFLTDTIEEESAIQIIERYLLTINEKNKNLNNRKLQKIREILDEVNDEVVKRLDTVRQIHNFLNSEEREITGGHRVTLKADLTSGYSKDWIDAYIDKLEVENTLFAVGETLNELLGDSVSIEEKMIRAFQAFGGHKGPKPKIEDLLNPNSYFGLQFKMESHATGKTNSGSTGQTYAAIALLCIARLSLVNKSSFSKNIPDGIRFMPIDEAEGLGSNFDMLYDIAKQFDYQLLTMSINPLGKFIDGEQYIYILSNNKETGEDVNYPPFGIFCEADTEAYTNQ